MRDFFINSLEKLLNVVVVIAAAVIVIGALGVLFGGAPSGMNRFLAFILILVIGFLYLVLVAGMAYLGLGIYQNTRRTAELLERRQP